MEHSTPCSLFCRVEDGVEYACAQSRMWEGSLVPRRPGDHERLKNIAETISHPLDIGVCWIWSDDGGGFACLEVGCHTEWREPHVAAIEALVAT